MRADSDDSIVRMHDSSPTQFSWSRVSAIKQRAESTNSILELGLAVARLGRFPMGRDHPQGADTELKTPTKKTERKNYVQKHRLPKDRLNEN